MDFINNLKLSTKLILVSSLFLIFFIGTNVYSIYQMKQMSELTTKLYNHPYAVSKIVRDINYNIVSMHRSMKDVVLANNREEINEAVSKVAINEQNVYKSFEVLEERFLGNMKKVIQAKQSFIQWKVIRDEVIYLMESKKNAKAAAITKGKGAQHVEKMHSHMSYLIEFATKKGVSFFENTKKIEHEVFNTMMIITLVSFVFIILISYVVLHNVKKSMKIFEKGLLSFFRYLNREDENMLYLDERYNDDFGEMSKLINKNITYTAENIEKEKKLTSVMQHQSKLAAMGEMVGAIAHQWRQPLNELGIRIQKVKRAFKKGTLDELYIENFVSNNMDTIRFMSKTIDDFRNFFRIDKQKTLFTLKDTVEDVINILQAQLKDNNINYHIEVQETNVIGYRNEFQQAIINIINNAKDVLLEKKIPNALITIKSSLDSLTIEDNAGGIPEDQINRIFEPYFTTKDQGQGTGMGLYLTKMIIEDNMNGKIVVYNNENGAVFKITFNGGDINEQQ